MSNRSRQLRGLSAAGVSLALAAVLMASGAASQKGPAVEDVGPLIRAVTAPDTKTYPERPPLSAEVRAGVEKELAGNAMRKASYAKLDAARRNVEWFEGIDELTKQGAVWCLATGLIHPNADAQIHSARALAKLRDVRAAPFLLTVAQANAIIVPGSENATIHGILQHELAVALDVTLRTEVRLKDGQDPNGLAAGLPVWRKALEKLRGK